MKERISEIKAEVKILDEEIECLKLARQKLYTELSVLVPPKPIKPAVNTPAQNAMNARIQADTQRMLNERHQQ